MLSEEALQISKEKRQEKSKAKREKYTQLNAKFQRLARKDKKAFLIEKYTKREENNRMGKTICQEPA